MKELSTKIDKIIELIDEMCRLIIINETQEANQKMPEFSALLMETFPDIVESYLRPEFADVKEDMHYWTSQLERMIQTIQGEDRFLFIDVLHYETRDNLLLYKKMIEGRA